MIGKNAEWKYFRRVSLSLREKMGDLLISMQKWSQSVKSSTSDELILNSRVFFGSIMPSVPIYGRGSSYSKWKSGMQTQVSESLDFLGTGARNMWVMGFQGRREAELLCLSWLGGLWSWTWGSGGCYCPWLVKPGELQKVGCCDHFLRRRLCVHWSSAILVRG